MQRIKGIEAVFGQVAFYKSSCPVIQEDDGTGQQRACYAVMCRERKGEGKLQQPYAWAIAPLTVVQTSEQVEQEYHQDTAPSIIHT